MPHRDTFPLQYSQGLEIGARARMLDFDNMSSQSDAAVVEEKSMTCVEQWRRRATFVDAPRSSLLCFFTPSPTSQKASRTWPKPAEASKRIPATSDTGTVELRRRAIERGGRKQEEKRKRIDSRAAVAPCFVAVGNGHKTLGGERKSRRHDFSSAFRFYFLFQVLGFFFFPFFFHFFCSTGSLF